MSLLPSLRPVLAALLLFPLAACQSARDFPAPGSHWKNAHGQLQYRTPQRSVIGEAVLSGNGTEEFQLDFLAGPGLPLMRLRESGDVARMEGLFAGMTGSWQGNPARARGRLASWAALREVFAALETKISAPSAMLQSAPGAPTPWRAQLTQAAGQPQRIRIEFPRTQEVFTFVLMR